MAGPPVYTVSRLQQVVTANLAQARAGHLSLDEVTTLVTGAFDSFAEQQATAAAVRDAEVTANAEGKVPADPAATSARAARLIEPKTGNQRGRILAYLVESSGWGATDYEIEKDLGILPNSVRPRRLELAEGGYLADSGTVRRHRGADWTVWVPTDEGRAWYRRNVRGAA